MVHGGGLRRAVIRGGRALALTLACLAVLVPLIYLVINSLKLQSEMYTIPPIIIPK